MGVAEPYYLEPGYDKAGDAGEERSRQYNDNLRYQNMRYAMLGTLRHPPAGFEAVVEGHFSAVREPLLLQCAKWIAEAGSADSWLRRSTSLVSDVMSPSQSGRKARPCPLSSSVVVSASILRGIHPSFSRSDTVSA